MNDPINKNSNDACPKYEKLSSSILSSHKIEYTLDYSSGKIVQVNTKWTL